MGSGRFRKMTLVLTLLTLCFGSMVSGCSRNSVTVPDSSQTAEPTSTIVELKITPETIITREYKNGRYYESVNGITTVMVEDLKKQTKILQLPFRFTDEEYASPSAVGGIVEDIPYNYYSNLDSSAEFVYSLLFRGYTVLEYSASSNAIYMELELPASSVDVEGNTIRIIIYSDYLKVYITNI